MSSLAKAIKGIVGTGSRKPGVAFSPAGVVLGNARASVSVSPSSRLDEYISAEDLEEILQVSPLLSLEDGYNIQKETEKHLIHAHGWRKCGFKVGATGAKVQQTLGIQSPFYGAIFHDQLSLKTLDDECMSCNFEIDDANGVNNKWCSFGAVSKALHNCRGIEAEFAFTLDRDVALRETPYTWEEIAEYVKDLSPCIEICGSRFSTPVPPGNAPLVVADGAGNSAFLVCSAHEVDVQEWINRCGSEMRVETLINFDQEKAITGSGMEVLRHPIHSLTWLANELNKEYISGRKDESNNAAHYEWRRLQAGDIVATGATSGLMAIDANSEVVIDFEGFGAVEMIMQE